MTVQSITRLLCLQCSFGSSSINLFRKSALRVHQRGFPWLWADGPPVYMSIARIRTSDGRDELSTVWMCCLREAPFEP